MNHRPSPPDEELAAWVKEHISPGRWRHTEGVMAFGLRLAERWGADPGKVRIAALLHDCARELPRESLLQQVDKFGIVRDVISDAEPVLYHGPVAAAWVRERWGIEDPDILQAIAVHTTGRAGMSLLEKVLFLADALEPGRDYPGVEALRERAFQDLDEAVREAIEGSLRYLLERGALIHPDALAARNDLLLQKRRIRA